MRERYSTQLAITAGVLILITTAVFSLVQSPELLEFKETAAVKSAADVPHSIEVRRQCTICHALQSRMPYPLKHAGWSVASCTKCHDSVKDPIPDRTTAQTDFPGAVDGKDRAQPLPHALEGMENCKDCHGFDEELPYPENHTGMNQQSCVTCHVPPVEEDVKEK